MLRKDFKFLNILEKKPIELKKKPIEKADRTKKKPINKADRTEKRPIEKADRKVNFYEKNKSRIHLVLNYLENKGSITNKEARGLLGLSESSTKRFLKQMVEKGLIKEEGERKYRRYLKL